MRTTDTIAAIATPMSESGIGIVRLSGEDAIEIADKIFRGRRPLKEEKTYTIHYGHVVEDGEVIDEVLVMLMRAPKSFTGEATGELIGRAEGWVCKECWWRFCVQEPIWQSQENLPSELL